MKSNRTLYISFCLGFTYKSAKANQRSFPVLSNTKLLKATENLQAALKALLDNWKDFKKAKEAAVTECSKWGINGDFSI